MSNKDMHQLEKTMRTCQSSAGVFGKYGQFCCNSNKKKRVRDWKKF